ncbi:MAG TPA: glutamate-cysteine ligase family protein [Opitutales bacterium]|nr:glutamate-cysteine ligase family protein [Opitutales bacterium]
MSTFHLFERHGVEMEYMIVDRESLDVRPIADFVLEKASGEKEASDAEFGRMAWSNELVRHVLEFKTAAPEPALDDLAELFQAEVVRANSMLAEKGAMLLPTGMHPWMNPHAETVLWPYGNKEIYQAFNRIFDCRGHGWSNLQSTHINLPFQGDDEFHRLHSAIRVVLPLIPAISASTPFADGRACPFLDTRLETYRHNCDRVPSITAGVVPVVITSEAEYREKILGKIYSDMEKLDPEGILRDEWANARGAIARFERNTVEIRVIDLQECPAADMGIVRYVTALVKALVEERLSPTEAQDAVPQEELHDTFSACVRDAGNALVDSKGLLKALGIGAKGPLKARDVHAALLEKLAPEGTPWKGVVAGIVRNGSLAERIRRAAGEKPGRERLKEVYARLGECLAKGEVFAANV